MKAAVAANTPSDVTVLSLMLLLLLLLVMLSVQTAAEEQWWLAAIPAVTAQSGSICPLVLSTVAAGSSHRVIPLCSGKSGCTSAMMAAMMAAMFLQCKKRRNTG